MEIAAVAAPRPQLLVAAQGDWTSQTLKVEGPAIAGIYRLFKAEDRLRSVLFNYGHNYNQASREAVYGWLGKWFLPDANPAAFKEQPSTKLAEKDLTVFPEGKLPDCALPQAAFIASLKEARCQQWQRLVPHDRRTMQKFREVMTPAWQCTLQVDSPGQVLEITHVTTKYAHTWQSTEWAIKHPSDTSAMMAVYFTPKTQGGQEKEKVAVLANSGDSGTLLDSEGIPRGLAGRLVAEHWKVLVVRAYSPVETNNPLGGFFTTYNRTKMQSRVRDLVSAVAAARLLAFKDLRAGSVVLVGLQQAGLWGLLAAPSADAVIADANALNVTEDQNLLGPDLYCPGLRNIGTFDGAATLTAPRPMLLHNVGGGFSTDGITAAYKAVGARRKLRMEQESVSDEAMAQWLLRL